MAEKKKAPHLIQPSVAAEIQECNVGKAASYLPVSLLQTEQGKEYANLITAGIPAGIMIASITQKGYPLRFINDRMLSYLGYERQEFCALFGEDLMGIVYPQDRPMVLAAIFDAQQKGADTENRTRLVHKDGQTLWVIERLQFLKDENKQPVILALFVDITDLMELKKSLEDQMVWFEQQTADLKAQKEALMEQARILVANEERFRVAFERTANVLFDYDIGSNNILYEGRWESLRDVIENRGDRKKNLLKGAMILPEYIHTFLGVFDLIKAGQECAECELKLRQKSGEESWAKIVLTGLRGSTGQVIRAVGMLQDITMQKEMEMAYMREEQYHRMAMTDVMAYYTANFTEQVFETYQISDPCCVPIEGKPSYEEFMSSDLEGRLTDDDQAAFLKTFCRESVTAAFDRGENEIFLEYLLKNSDGSELWVQNVMYLVTDEKTGIRRVFLYVRNIDERKRREIKLMYQSERDPLTDLYNKRCVEKYIRQALATPEGESNGVLMMVDIDHFKAVNDTFGHPFGDLVLKEAARILQNSFREADFLGRIGGDEFCVFLVGHTGEDKIAQVAQRICDRMRGMEIPGHGAVKVSCSIGVARCEGEEMTFETLYAQADKALYHAKSSGRDRFAVFGMC